jgi:NDP-sugar pyrophosphorylase family protein
MSLKAADLFALPPSLAAFAPHFPAEAAPWTWLKAIGPALGNLTRQVPAALPPGVSIDETKGAVWLHPSVQVPHTCTIIGPAWIGAKTEIRPGAFIRGNVIVGEGCVLGNACEFKNALLMDGVQVPHFSYVGDTILGNKAHLGAGVICSNLRLDQKSVRVRFPDGSKVDSGLRKFGAILGDAAEVGCNSVLQPGTVLGRRALVFPLTPFAGVLEANTIATVRTDGIVRMPRQD